MILSRSVGTMGVLSAIVVGFVACSSSSDTAGGAPVIEAVEVSGVAKKAADGKYEATLRVTAHDDGTIVSARIDFPSDEPASLVGTEVQVNQQKLAASPITFRLDAAAGPGTGDANLVLTDDAGNVAKKKIIVTTSD
jgi:hypothetical protein